MSERTENIEAQANVAFEAHRGHFLRMVLTDVAYVIRCQSCDKDVLALLAPGGPV